MHIDFLLGVGTWMASLSAEPTYNHLVASNHLNLLAAVSIFMNQAYTALYYLDISYIHRLFFLREDYQYFVDKKLRLNML